MLLPQTALCLSSLLLLSAAVQTEDAFRRGIQPTFIRSPTLTTNTTSRMFTRRDVNDPCLTTCDECVGDGWIHCPDSSTQCYFPYDDEYGLITCTTGITSTDTTSSGGSDDVCYQAGATCQSCFGSSYLECPDGEHCYDPSDPLYDTCDDSGSSGGGGSSSSSSSTCEELYGVGSVSCGEDSCYNPADGEVCCEDGYHCEDGFSCSSLVGKCCAPGSTLSSCSGSSGGVGTSSSSGSSRTTATAAGTSSTSTSGVSSGSSLNGSNGAGMLGVQRVLLFAAGLGALAL